ncbi:MAG: Rrf2 family transcriptional regulator [Candidatus Neomarinimicrobiota bacterium]|mgnify:CR=1 FL=1|nr:Rrf2 family transcriptional regulator [Candidatus Neomarinimicrobiota bacterium]RKY49957.1 MAG: Rrf2 family transcriptional regulator [Candidatus Neomarinimicrobiota bacterium]
MKLSAKSEYAILALIDLAERESGGLHHIEDIARRKNIPRKFLEQILLILKRAGYVRSKRGAEGGYRIGKNPSEISLAEIIRLMDGALAPVDSVSVYFYEKTPIEQNQKLIDVFREIRDYISTTMEGTHISDLV